jgi:hypothetical protein
VKSSDLKEQFWDIVPKMQTAVGCSQAILKATAKWHLPGGRMKKLMEPIMVITAQLLMETL